MRKSFVVFIITLVLAVGVIVFGQNRILSQKDQVQITEQVHLGDKSVVEGVTLELNTTYEDQLFWDTAYVIGEEPKVNTEYRFTQLREHNYSWRHDGHLYFNDDTLHDLEWFSEQEAEELEGVELAVWNLYQVLGPSEYGEKTFYLNEYEDYYHFSVSFQNSYDRKTSDLTVFFELGERELKEEIARGKAENRDVGRMEQQLEWMECFQEYFKIPVLENEQNNIAMRKDEKGEVTGFALSSVSGGFGTGDVEIPEPPDAETEDAFRFDTRFCISENEVYFTFNTRSIQGKTVDTSLIPGGYGIYHFPYDAEKEEIYPEQLQMVYALDTNIEIYDITKDVCGEHLLLFTLEDDETMGDALYMSVIDLATMTLENKIVISDLGVDQTVYGLDYYILYEDYMVVRTFGELVLFTIDENGNYKKEFQLSEKQLKVLQVDQNAGMPIPNSTTVYDWNGEHLVFADYLFGSNGYLSTSFYVAVVNEDGVEYFATYDSSLDSAASKDLNGYENHNYKDCRPIDVEGISVRWE